MKGYPLGLEVVSMEVRISEFNADFIRQVLPSLDWPAVLIGASAVGMQGLPSELAVSLQDDPSFLKAIHNLLLEIHVIEGALVCPESGRRFEIKQEIPNMMLPESDV